MKILCVIDSLGSGGAQRQIVELALGFHDYGHEVVFLTYSPESFYSSYLKNAGISIIFIAGDSYIRRFLKMRYFIRKGRFNAVLSFLEASNFICELSGFPFKKWNLVVGERSSNPNIRKSLKLIVYRWFHLTADFVVANSHANMQIVKFVNPLLSTSKCRIIYNIVDFNNWGPPVNYSPRKSGKLKLVIAASHKRMKNLNGLITAISLLSPDEKSRLEVEWYGDKITAPYFDNSLTEAREIMRNFHLDDIISFYPATKDLNLKIRQADVVGLFSFYEGLPNAVCEGMACAKTVICSAVSDMTSILSYDKNLIFQPDNITSIQNTLKYIISLTNQQLISIGQINEKIAKEKFDKDLIVNKYLDLLSV